MPCEETDVAIIGGGPVGLSAAVLLGRIGISCALFERNASTSFHPRGHVVNARTMEILRQVGAEADVSEAALPIARHAGVGFMTSLAGEEIGSIRTRGEPALDAIEQSMSPTLKRSCPQDVLEPILRKHAAAVPTTALYFQTEITNVEQDADGVRLPWRTADGRIGTTRSKYVIAADGARSTTRECLGIGMSGGSMGQQIGIYFHADLWPWIKDRPYLLWWIYNSKTSGVFISLDGRHRWTYNFSYPETEARGEYTRERCQALIRAAVGVPNIDVDIQSIMPWRMQARMAHHFRAGRVFLAGDSAHPLPPTGGQGMNTGVADVHNLVWKLALVLRGRSSERLLETYETERMPAARFNVEQSILNAKKMAESGLGGMLMNDSKVTQEIEGPEGAKIRAQLDAAIPAQREHFDYAGQTFGYAYESELITPDDTPAPVMSVDRYEPTARPGHRAPHYWLNRQGERISTIDLFGGANFVLLAGEEGAIWIDAFRQVLTRHGINGAAYLVGPNGNLTDPDDGWLPLYGLSSSGALIVRPDGHVMWRAKAAPADAMNALDLALRRGIGLHPESGKSVGALEKTG